jgi:hypothetical protein
MHLSRPGQVPSHFVDALRSEALKLAEGLAVTASNLERVAAKTSVVASCWAFDQWQLRKEATRKGFPRASEMLFTREALEQASHFEVARFHASRFPKGALVADLTFGIGSDLLALAERGPVVGFDVDVVRLECAQHNLAVHGFDADLRWANCLEADWDFEYAVGDPSRRVEGRRTLDPEDFEPNPRLLAERMSELRLGLLKLSPMLNDDYLTSLGPGLAFVSYAGQCREALIFCGSEAVPGRFAMNVKTGEELAAGDAVFSVENPEAFFYEADPAAIRAHGLASFSMAALGDSNGYLTSNQEVQVAWLTAYRVLASGRFDLKAAKALLKEFGVGRVVVKSRVSGMDVVRIGKDLAGSGKKEGIVALYPVGKSVRFALIERI